MLLDPKPTTSAWRDEEAAKSRSLAALRLVVRQAAAEGILVLLDLHRLIGSACGARLQTAPRPQAGEGTRPVTPSL